MKKSALFIVGLGLFAMLSTEAFSQAMRGYRYRSFTRFGQKTHWWEIYAGLGATNFLGELGGSNDIGTNFAKDLDIEATRWSYQMGAKYFYVPRFAQKFQFTYARLRGDDKWTQQPNRRFRNLNFRAPVFELGTQLEGYIIKEGKQASRYKLAGIKQKKSNPMELYVHAGFHGIYFNPRGLNPQTNTWVSLQPLCTEGQGVINARPKYSRFSYVFTYGLGATFRIAEDWKIGIEGSMRQTFTDYIDDVSTTYVSKEILKQTSSPNKDLSILMADKSMYSDLWGNGGDPAQTRPGEQRGDPRDLDAYMSLMIHVYYKLAGGGRGTIPKFF